MTGHTDRGRSLNRSPASIEESSMTHAPSAGDRCRPRPSWTVWKVGSGIVTRSWNPGWADPRGAARCTHHPERVIRRRLSPAADSPLQRQGAAEDLAPDLGGAAADGAERGVARHALELDLLEVTGAAVQLQAGVDDVEGRALGQELGHRHLADDVLAGAEAAQRVVGRAAAGVDGRGEVGQAVADRLVAGERAAERPALTDVGQRAVEGLLHRRDGAERHEQPL